MVTIKLIPEDLVDSQTRSIANDDSNAGMTVHSPNSRKSGEFPSPFLIPSFHSSVSVVLDKADQEGRLITLIKSQK